MQLSARRRCRRRHHPSQGTRTQYTPQINHHAVPLLPPLPLPSPLPPPEPHPTPPTPTPPTPTPPNTARRDATTRRIARRGGRTEGHPERLPRLSPRRSDLRTGAISFRKLRGKLFRCPPDHGDTNDKCHPPICMHRRKNGNPTEEVLSILNLALQFNKQSNVSIHSLLRRLACSWYPWEFVEALHSVTQSFAMLVPRRPMLPLFNRRRGNAR